MQIKKPLNFKRKNKNNKDKNFLGQFGSQVLLTLLIFISLIAIYGLLVENRQQVREIAISELTRDISDDQVSSIIVRGDKLEIKYIDGEEGVSRKETDAPLSQTLVNHGLDPITLRDLDISVESPTGWGYWALNLLPFLLPIVFIIFLFWMITRQVKGASMQAFSFGQSKARMIDPNDKQQKVLFKDVAGVKEAKEELLEVVEFLRSPAKFLNIGARIPKGVILMGPPGAGKTLLARAVAGEAHVPFFYLSGSEFVEMFVGVGASRVRDLFQMAKKSAPAIIFIDEIDAIGRHRGSGMGGGNDEREQTLNQILVEMDGFEPHEKLIVVAATNRPDVLDTALLRPGRFDRRVVLDLPDINDREAILKIHARKKPLAKDVNLRTVAQRTPGFTGADLNNVMNESAILAAREDRQEIIQDDLLRSVEKVMLGPERKSHILSEHEKKITAYHEIGHALVASLMPEADPVHKVSIISRGHAAGYTLKLPFEDRKLNSRKEFLADLAMSLGGYTAEKLVFDDITTGAGNDIRVATALARDMVVRYGMSERIGPVAYDFSGPRIHQGEIISNEGKVSEDRQKIIDEEVSRLMSEALKQAESILKENRQALDEMSAELIKRETLERKDFEDLLLLHGIRPKEENNS